MPARLTSIPRGPLVVIVTAALLLVIDDWLPDLPYLDTDFVAIVLCFAIGAAALLPLVHVGFERDRLARTAARVLAALVAVVLSLSIALVAAEFATRWLYRNVTTTANDRGYFTRRWQRGQPDSRNAYGFREREFDAAKVPGVYRIAVVGDSFTYGNGLPVGQRFTNVMQQSLPADYEVLNFGVPGHNTLDHVTTIRDTVLRLHPDFIVVQWFVNDVEGAGLVPRPTYLPLLPFRDLNRQLSDMSAFYTLAGIWWTRWQANWTGTTYVDFLQTNYGDPHSEGARLDRDATLALFTICRDHGLPLGIVLFPDSGYDLGADYPFASLHRRVMEACDGAGVTCVDLRPDFATVKDRSKLWVDALDHHPSARANTMAAARILATFSPAWTALHHHS